MDQKMARNQYYYQIKTPISTWHRRLHDGVALTDCDFLPICPACAAPLLIADTIYNRDNRFKGKSDWLNKPYKFIAQKCEIPFFTIWYTVQEISEKERPIIEFNIKRQYPYSNKPIQTLTPDQMLQYLEWKVQQHIPECNSKEYLLKRVTAVTETNSKFERLNNYVKLLSQ